jgi:DNA replication and repair protein RecF
LYIKSFQINNLRNIQSAEIVADPVLNVLVGDNGAGKTTVLEAMIVLAKGRSFRTGQIASLLGSSSDQFLISAKIQLETDRTSAVGVERSVKHWRARRDGKDVRQLSDLAEHLPLVLLEPNSHLLISGPPDSRRRYLDWGVFHVEHGFLGTWRRYARAIKQRNAALRAKEEGVAQSLNPLIVDLGEQVHRLREAQVAVLEHRLPGLLADLAPGLEDISLRYQPGWSGPSLGSALDDSFSRDMDRGLTGPGPHKADLVFRSGRHLARDCLSRGEMKIVAAAMMMAQARAISEAGSRAVFLLDDLASEFDAQHRQSVIRAALVEGGQVWITGTQLEEGLLGLASSARVFHVEQGRVSTA